MKPTTGGGRIAEDEEFTDATTPDDGEEAGSTDNSQSWIRAYAPTIRRIRRRCLMGGVLVVTSAIAEVSGLASLGVAATTSDHTMGQALVIAFAIAGSLAIAAAARAAAEWQYVKAQVQLERELRGDVTDAILRCEWQDFVNQPGHELQSAALSEAPQVSQVTVIFARGCAQACAGAAVFASAFLVSPVAAALCTGFGIPVVYLHRRSARGLRPVQELLATGTQEITRQTMILVNGLRSLRLSPVQGRWRAELDQTFQAYSVARSADLTIPIRGRLLVDLIASGMILSVLVAQQLLTGNLLPGLIVMALILRTLPRLQTAQQQLAFAENGASWIHRWRRRLNILSSDVRSPTAFARAATADSGFPEPAETDSVLRLESVTFGYRGHERPVLRDLDLDLRVGEWVSLRGPSGQGKSTLVDIVGGILAPQQGRVLFCGQNLASYAASELYRRVAVVPQEVYLVGTTVHEILLWGEMMSPLSPCELDEVAAALGVDQMFSFGGNRAAQLDELSRDISGGMRTRLAMARALVGRPDLLILDETTSRLHPEAEAEVFAAVRRLQPTLTVLVVTHRGETTARVDRRLVLCDGGLNDE